tara:strand:+ start:152 stop:409 length:258 start_codon:yes stop_codon:yes gene_type:complete
MKGTVTISLKDYEKLAESIKQYDELKTKTTYAVKELQVFISFLSSRADLVDHINEFNRQSKSSEIIVKNGIATIKSKDDNRISNT